MPRLITKMVVRKDMIKASIYETTLCPLLSSISSEIALINGIMRQAIVDRIVVAVFIHIPTCWQLNGHLKPDLRPLTSSIRYDTSFGNDNLTN